MLKSKLTAYLLLLIGLLTACTSANSSAPLACSDSANLYFAENCGHSSYLELSTSGKYREYSRGHFDVSIVDEGQWWRDANGDYVLHSSQVFHGIGVGSSAWISPKTQDQVLLLPELANRLRDLLATHPDAPTFPTGDLVELSRFDDTVLVYSINASAQIPRPEIVALLDAIAHYPQAPNDMTFHFATVPYRGYCYLRWFDSGYFRMTSEYLLRSRLDDALASGDRPFCAWHAIPESEFEAGISHPEPFKGSPKAPLPTPRAQLDA